MGAAIMHVLLLVNSELNKFHRKEKRRELHGGIDIPGKNMNKTKNLCL